MKHYLKLSFLFFVFTMGVTLWMSYELGLLGFGKLEAAEEVKSETKPVAKQEEKKDLALTQESKPLEAKLIEEQPSTELKVADAKPVKEDANSSAIVPPAPPVKPAVRDVSELPLSEREKYVSEREEFLRKQSEYYERVIVELKEKLMAQERANKQSVVKNEAGFQSKLSEKDSQWKTKMEKNDSEWKSKVAEKDAENEKLKKELTTWKDARAELFRGLYEKMDSKRSAKILETMDIDLSNKIIAGMKQDKAAEIMSKMIPEKAKLITEKTFQNRELSSQDKVNKSQGAVLEKSP